LGPLPAPPPPARAKEVSDDNDPSANSMAMRHLTEESRTYPCEACGGELHFDIRSQFLKCAHCGNTHELMENNGRVDERDLREALRLLQLNKQSHEQTFIDLDKEITCQNCGGNTTFSGSLTAEKCPYCATPIQLDDVHDAPERLPVDGVLPFSIDDKQAKELIGKWISGRWFAPTEFKTYGRTGAFSSVYMAYFTYDADARTQYTGRRGDYYTVTVGSGENRRTETRTSWRRASGTVNNSFDDITVFANEGFERNRIAKLEPWPTETAKPYSAEYAAGHLRRTYDLDVEECLPEATAQMEAAITQTIRQDIGGDQQDINSMNISWLKMTYKHLLLPIWLLTVIYEQKPFQVYINGVTGEVHGSRPYSKVKILTAVMLAALVIVAVVIAVSASGSG